jgi:hypothetical protein
VQTVERPRFRNDLVAQPLEEEGVRYVDVTDPASGSTFRFYDIEYSIACAMDGAKDLVGLAEWTRAELGIETSPEELSNVVATLADLGYLEAAHAATAPQASAATTRTDDIMPADVGGADGRGLGDAATAAEVSAAYDEAMEDTTVRGGPDRAARGIAMPEAAAGAASTTLRTDDSHAEISLVDDVARSPAPPPSPPRPAIGDSETSFEGLMDEDATKPAVKAASPTSQPVGGARAFQDDDEPTRIPAPAVEDDDEDVSVDLSAHLRVGKEEVVEAVRSSRVMTVPELPKDLTDETDEVRSALAAAVSGAGPLPSEPRAVAEAHDPDATEVPTKVRPEAMPLPPPPEPRAAIQLPRNPPGARPIAPTKQPPPAVAAGEKKKSSSSVGLLLFLMVLLAGAVAVYFFRDKIFGGDEPTEVKTRPTTKKPGPATTRPVQPKPSPVAPPPTAVLALQGGGVELTATAEGTVAWHIENGAEVQAGDVVAKLAGFQQAENALARAQKALAEHTERLQFYTEKQNAAKVAEKQAWVDKDKADIAAAEAKLAQLVLKAPQAGTAQLLAGKGAKVTAGSPIVKIGGEPQLTASFTVGEAASQYTPDAACSVAAKGARDKEYACSVVSVENGAVVVRLVSGAQAAEGDEVVLLPAKK